MARARRTLLAGAVLVAVVLGGVLGGPATAQESTATPTPTETSGVASERGLASFALIVVLVGGTLLYLRRRRTTD